MTMQDNNKKTILYADYSERNIRAAKVAIDPLGFAEFIECDDREKTVELVTSLKPDIVLIGLYLDGMRGVSTIRSIRESITESNRHGAEVPILLGAPKLDRRAMRDAVDAGIEGLFRQPVDPVRLRKIIISAMNKPRRFVLEGEYFGPARSNDASQDDATAKTKFGAKSGTRISASVSGTKPQRDATSGQNIDSGESSPKKAAAKSSPDAPETESLEARNRRAILAARDLLKPDPLPKKPAPKKKPAKAETKTPKPKPKPKPKPEAEVKAEPEQPPAQVQEKAEADSINIAVAKPLPIPAQPKAAEQVSENAALAPDEGLDAEELIAINLKEALVGHKLWVDTGGKEGSVMSIEHADLRDADLEGIDLSRCGLRFASFKNANCNNAVLRRCDLTAADFVESNLESANLAASRLSGARFTKAILRNTVFLGSDLSNANFNGMQFFNCDFSGTNLAGADFRDADLTSVNGLFAEQIQRARVNINTRLPRHLKLRD